MKKTIMGLMVLASFNLNAQKMNSPIDVVTSLFIATDERNWSQLENVFHTTVTLDYSSMNNNPATELNPSAIIESWKGILPGFTYTHHQLGNFQEEVDKERAHVFCYGTATHYLEDANGNIWTVVGTYDFDLIKSEDGSWRVSSMKFNFKYMEGNLSLPEKAIKYLKQ